MSRRFFILLCLIAFMLPAMSRAQSVEAERLFYSIRSRILTVKDYTADVKMKIDVPFIRVPPLTGKLYFKAPDKMKLERNGGLSILPKKEISLSLNNLIPEGSVTVIDAGYANLGNLKARVLKVLPDNEQTDIVLAKIWIDEA